MFEKTEEQKELAERQASEDKHLQQRQEDELNEKLESLVKAEQAFWEGHENDSEEQKKQYEGSLQQIRESELQKLGEVQAQERETQDQRHAEEHDQLMAEQGLPTIGGPADPSRSGPDEPEPPPPRPRQRRPLPSGSGCDQQAPSRRTRSRAEHHETSPPLNFSRSVRYLFDAPR